MSTYITIDKIDKLKVKTTEGLKDVPVSKFPAKVQQEIRLLDDIRQELADKQYEVKRLLLALATQKDNLNKLLNSLNSGDSESTSIDDT